MRHTCCEYSPQILSPQNPPRTQQRVEMNPTFQKFGLILFPVCQALYCKAASVFQQDMSDSDEEEEKSDSSDSDEDDETSGSTDSDDDDDEVIKPAPPAAAKTDYSAMK